MTYKMTITVKEPDEIGNLCDTLNLDKATYRDYFEFGEYATFELEIDEAMKVVAGRIVPWTEL
jgi:hypothetical protein